MTSLYHHHSQHQPSITSFQFFKRSMLCKLLLICFIAFLFGLLSGCSSVKEISIIPNEPAPTLRLQPPEPLLLEKDYEWKIFKENDTTILGLTEDGYKSHQRNMESIQNRLSLLMEYLNQYRLFYEKDE